MPVPPLLPNVLLPQPPSSHPVVKEGDAELHRLIAESSRLLLRLLPGGQPPPPNDGAAARAAEPPPRRAAAGFAPPASMAMPPPKQQQQQQQRPPPSFAFSNGGRMDDFPDLEPSDFRGATDEPTNNEYVNVLLRESFLDASDDEHAATGGANNGLGSPPAPMPAATNGNDVLQRQIDNQPLHRQQVLGTPPNQSLPPSQQPPQPSLLQEQLDRASQRQMQQFTFQQLQRQDNLEPQNQMGLLQLLQQQQQQLQDRTQPQLAPQPQSSVQSMQSDLQALQALHKQGGAGDDRRPPPPAQPSRKKARKNARSMSLGSHNPRADNSSNWDAVAREEAAAASGEGGSGSGSEFRYVQVVGGGIHPRRATVDSSSAPPPQARAGSGGPDGVVARPGPRGGAVGAPSSAPKRPRQASSPGASLQEYLDRQASPPGSLQEYLDSLLTSRGYAPRRRPASDLNYRRPPTPLQLASFGSAVCATIKPGGADRLSTLLGAGLSPQPTNKFGDSPFFLACKRGLPGHVRAFLDAGADVRAADGFGRTPLHHVAWSNPPALDAARLILRAAGPEEGGRLLYVADAHGKTPLDFVGERHRSAWVDLIEEIKDECWPAMGGGAGAGYFPEPREDDGPAVDPEGALSPDLAAAVASGDLSPEEARRRSSLRE